MLPKPNTRSNHRLKYRLSGFKLKRREEKGKKKKSVLIVQACKPKIIWEKSQKEVTFHMIKVMYLEKNHQSIL